MRSITLTVPLTLGSVTLRAWGAHVTDALTLDLLTVSATLGELRGGEYPDAEASMIEPRVWKAFFRLVRLSLDGTPLPATTFAERMALLDAMWTLNDVEDAEGKLSGLSVRAARELTRRLDRIRQALPTTPSTSSSSGTSG